MSSAGAGLLRRTRRPRSGRGREGGRPESLDGWRPSSGEHPPLDRRHRRHMGLRMRITIVFALGAAVLAGSISTITYYSVRNSILSQENTALVHDASASAITLSQSLIGGNFSGYAFYLLGRFAPPDAIDTVLYQDGSWSASGGPVYYPAQKPVPETLRTLVLGHTSASETILLDNVPTYVVGIWIPSVHAAYFALFNLSAQARTLHVLFASLLIAALIVTAAAAILGSWAASRALRPLHEVAGAALDIASGHLDTRLETDDYTDLAVLTAAFNRMADRLQERIEREVSFTSDVNHELRSPLTTLAAALGVLESRRDELPERSQKALDLLGAEVRRFRRLVDDLLEISRLDAGLSDVNMAEVPLGDLVRRSVAAAGRPVPIDFVEGAEERHVVVDKRRFERILANLLDNAQHYAGGATRVAVALEGETARVAVEDEGPGIPPDERERIFDRFSRGTSGRRRGLGEGTGLGLAIVSEHLRILGGRVWVEANGVRGARFVVELPLAEEDVTA